MTRSFSAVLFLTHFLAHMESQIPPSKIARLADYSSTLSLSHYPVSLLLPFSLNKFKFFCSVWFLGIGQTSCLNVERHGYNRGSAGSPPIGLGLALGRGRSTDHTPMPIPACSGFTILQLQELQLQSLIYKYIESGFSVPYHLVLPIWKSVSSSLSGSNSKLYQLYPSCKFLPSTS